MAVVNSGDPVNTLQNALEAYVSVQKIMAEEAAKLKDNRGTQANGEQAQPERGATNAVPS